MIRSSQTGPLGCKEVKNDDTGTMASTLALATAEGVAYMESLVGRKVEELYAKWAVSEPFLLDFGDEALRLADELG